jgi:UDP-N-acetyl-D-glucosamine/UDP-N-acetyl-D-galactosamine dehydrogenase
LPRRRCRAIWVAVALRNEEQSVLSLPGKPKIAVIGLGYVGLPLAVALSHHFEVVGFDVDRRRIAELADGHDRTREATPAALEAAEAAGFRLAADPDVLAGCQLFIVTVPTPVTAENRPDLAAVVGASHSVGAVLMQGAVVVYESTVYPGVTEDVCGPILEEASGLVCGRDFFLGYSPERINPGDRVHALDKIVKVVAGQTPEVTAWLAEVYGRVTEAGVFCAASIRTAEAAKVIENAQRDINIAFINEVTKIFNTMDISVYDVLAAARTKWNFLDFRPGLVGGHCIGVDPYYLAHCSETLGLEPQVILAGRRTNDSMGQYFAERVLSAVNATASAPAGSRRILVLGLTFKENVPDLRNSRVPDILRELREYGIEALVHDARADAEEALAEYGVRLCDWPDLRGLDAVVLAVPHATYLERLDAELSSMLAPGGIVIDVKSALRAAQLPEGARYWSL